MHNHLQPYSNFSSKARWRSKRIYLIGALGTVIEWYDFALYGCFAHVLAQAFFPNQHNSILMVYAIFFISYLARPLGGLLYGLVGDYWGRKPALLASILMMTGCMFVTACLPTWKSVGELAPLVLIILRIIQGLSVGGETAGALIYVLESVNHKHQGGYGATTWSMTRSGALLATITVVIFMHLLNDAQLLAWGWRAAYLIGGLAGLTIFIIRLHIPESLEFYAEQQRLIKEKLSGIDKKILLKEVITNHKLTIAQIIILLAFVCGIGGFVYTYFPIYLHQYFAIHLVTGWSLQISIDILIMICLLLSGILSDRLGRKRLPMIASIFFLLFSYPLLSLLSPGQWHIAVIVLVLLATALSMHAGPLPALIVQLAPRQVRYTVFALGYNIAFSIFAGSSPLVCAMLARLSPLAPAFYFMVLAALSLIVLHFINKHDALDSTTQTPVVAA